MQIYIFHGGPIFFFPWVKNMSSVGPKGQETPRGTFFKLIAYFIIFSNINSEKINSCSVYAIQIL
jgi:hypothetical protein